MAFDFRYAYLPAAQAVLHGHSPFPPATAAALTPRTAFVYPPLTAWLAAPFTVLPPLAVQFVISLIAVVCVGAVLLLLGVRDWRCYMISFLWLPTYSAVQTANVMLLVAVGSAAVWRFRDRAPVAAVATGFVIALKVVAWPLLLWLAIRRRRTAIGGAIAAAGFILLPWAAIGFAGLTGYPHLLRMLAQVEWRQEYTIAAALSGVLPAAAATAIGYSAAVAVLVAALRISRKDERRGFALVVAATLLLSPVAHLDYFVLLLLPLGLLRPRFDALWTLPLLLWAAPQVGNGAGWQTATALAVAAAVFMLGARWSGSGQHREGSSNLPAGPVGCTNSAPVPNLGVLQGRLNKCTPRANRPHRG
jgi:glycosyl transferase family 87